MPTKKEHRDWQLATKRGERVKLDRKTYSEREPVRGATLIRC